MTGADAIREAARQYAAESRTEQGLPPVVEDPVAIGRIVALLRAGGGGRE